MHIITSLSHNLQVSVFREYKFVLFSVTVEAPGSHKSDLY